MELVNDLYDLKSAFFNFINTSTILHIHSTINTIATNGFCVHYYHDITIFMDILIYLIIICVLNNFLIFIMLFIFINVFDNLNSAKIVIISSYR